MTAFLWYYNVWYVRVALTLTSYPLLVVREMSRPPRLRPLEPRKSAHQNPAEMKRAFRIAVSRYRIIMSDGNHYTQATLATPLNHLVVDQKVIKNSIVCVERSTCNCVQGKWWVNFARLLSFSF